GKTIRLVVASEAGGGYDAYARAFAQHLRSHLAGEPSVIVQNMPGAAGIVATNWLANSAPKDGLTIRLSQIGMPFRPLLGDPSAQYDPAAINWLGSFTGETGIVALWKTAKVQTMADALTETALMGGSGPNTSETYPTLLNSTLGTRFKIVSGYP